MQYLSSFSFLFYHRYHFFLWKIQATIEEMIRKQSEAIGKKRPTAKATASAFARKYRRNVRTRGRGRTVARDIAPTGSDDEDRDPGPRIPAARRWPPSRGVWGRGGGCGGRRAGRDDWKGERREVARPGGCGRRRKREEDRKINKELDGWMDAGSRCARSCVYMYIFGEPGVVSCVWRVGASLASTAV